LEAKRRAEGKLTEKLSKKQIDAKKAQLEIESAIRVKVNKVMTVVTFPSLIFSTIYTRAHTHGRNSRF